MHYTAELAVRKRLEINKKQFLLRWERVIGIAIQRRMACMIRAGLPKPAGETEKLALGRAGEQEVEEARGR